MNVIDIRKSISYVRNKIMGRKKQYTKVFSTIEGKMVLAEIYKYAGLNRPSYVEGNPDRTAYNEGMKRVALHIKGVLKQTDLDVDELVENYKKSVNYNPTNQ